MSDMLLAYVVLLVWIGVVIELCCFRVWLKAKSKQSQIDNESANPFRKED